MQNPEGRVPLGFSLKNLFSIFLSLHNPALKPPMLAVVHEDTPPSEQISLTYFLPNLLF